MDKTKVIFKKVPSKPKYNAYPEEIIAFFPDIEANYGNIMSYAHHGQHGEASLAFYHDCYNVAPWQYADLKEELESIGYNLVVRKRLTSR